MGGILQMSGPAVNTANLEVFTLADLHTYRGTTGKTSDDTRLQLVVDGINYALWEFLRRRFIKATGTPFDLVLDGPAWDGPLYLPHAPIVSLTSLKRGHFDSSGWVDDYTYVSTDYVKEDHVGRITATSSQTFPRAKRSIRAVYTAGYATIPADLKVAAMAWASVTYARPAANRDDVISEAFEGGSTSFTFDTMPPASRAVFERYMRKDQLVLG